MPRLRRALQSLVTLGLVLVPGIAQSGGQLSGTIVLEGTGGPMHGASILIVELGRSTISGHDGRYQFANVPPGAYHVVAHLDPVFTEDP